MATDKKGFILYADQKELFDQLPNEKAGELIKHIFSYVNDEDPQTEDLLIKLAFTPIKQQLKRDLKKFEEVREKRSEAGKKSAEMRKQKATKSTSVKSVEQTLTKATVKDNDNVTVKDNVKDIIKNAKAFKTQTEFLEWFNKGKEYYTKVKGKTRTMSKTDINNFKKLNEVYNRRDFSHAIKMLTKSKWAIDENMIIPAHFLRIDNFTKYLNQDDTQDNRISLNLPAN